MVLYSRKGGTKKKQRYEKLITKYRKRRQKRTRNRDFYKLETRSKAPSKYRTRQNNKSFKWGNYTILFNGDEENLKGSKL